MAGDTKNFILLLFLQQFLYLQGAKILTICLMGGSHYLMMDEISRILQNNGHEVRMFHQFGKGLLPGYKSRTSPYQETTFSFEENYIQEYKEFITQFGTESLKGRPVIQYSLAHMGHMSNQCKMILNQSHILDFLKDEKYDIAIVEAFNPCSFLVSEKLGIPYISFFHLSFVNAGQIGMPSPLSYVPLYRSSLTDRMTFLERVKNTLMYFSTLMLEKIFISVFDHVIEEHFPGGSIPSLFHLYMKAELWIYNTDFSFEFPRPLLPNVQYIGGLLAKPSKPVSQELEYFISKAGESGFIVVSMGSMISSVPVIELLREMNAGLSKIPQNVIWRYQKSHWPKDLELAPNVRLLDWVSQNDLLGHPKVRLLVTHGGVNSLMEAVYHGVPVLGIPLFGDQFDNLVRIKAKNMGTFMLPNELRSENFASTIRQIAENKSYKMSAMNMSTIMRSRPFPPDQQLLRWVEHIIQSGGGGHLRPYSYQQPWYQQCLLDVILFISACLIMTVYLIVKVFRVLIRFIYSSQKIKQK